MEDRCSLNPGGLNYATGATLLGVNFQKSGTSEECSGRHNGQEVLDTTSAAGNCHNGVCDTESVSTEAGLLNVSCQGVGNSEDHSEVATELEKLDDTGPSRYQSDGKHDVETRVGSSPQTRPEYTCILLNERVLSSPPSASPDSTAFSSHATSIGGNAGINEASTRCDTANLEREPQELPRTFRHTFAHDHIAHNVLESATSIPSDSPSLSPIEPENFSTNSIDVLHLAEKPGSEAQHSRYALIDTQLQESVFSPLSRTSAKIYFWAYTPLRHKGRTDPDAIYIGVRRKQSSDPDESNFGMELVEIYIPPSKSSVARSIFGAEMMDDPSRPHVFFPILPGIDYPGGREKLAETLNYLFKAESPYGIYSCTSVNAEFELQSTKQIIQNNCIVTWAPHKEQDCLVCHFSYHNSEEYYMLFIDTTNQEFIQDFDGNPVCLLNSNCETSR